MKNWRPHLAWAALPILTVSTFTSGPAVQAMQPAYNRVTLPNDARMHADAQTEWWYYTGHLRDAAGGTYGFEMVTFKFQGLKRIEPLSPFDVGYRIDVAVTDETRHTFNSTVNYVVPSAGKTVLSTRSLDLRMQGNTAAMRVTTMAAPDLAYRLGGSLPGGALDLTVHTARRPLLEGGQGVVPMGAGGFSYYYSLTNMITRGTLTLGGKKLAVTGTTWMDHQWGSWKWSAIRGWDWMGVQLSNGTSVVLSNFAGAKLSLKSAAVSFGNGSQLITTASQMTPLSHVWVSPATSTRYPQGWHVRVPAIGLDAIVTPTVPNQEVVDLLSLGPTYWEGSCRLTGTLKGKPITGLTYTELVGYGKRSALEM